MTPTQLKALRIAIAPSLSQGAFARAMGYADKNSYRRYEGEYRTIPDLLAKLMQAMADTGWRPDGWPAQPTNTPAQRGEGNKT